ncbi:MAG: hypothetical protein ABJF01_26840 [bacterium]
MCTRFSCALLGAASLLSASVVSDTRAQATPQFSIDWYVVNSGGSQVRNDCFVLTGTTGQPTPGYSSGGAYALLSGFWSVAPISGSDVIFFNGFEGCSP